MAKNSEFIDMYYYIIDSVVNHPTEIFTETVFNRLEKCGLLDSLTTFDFTECLQEDECGKITIDNVNYSLSPEMHMIINIASYEVAHKLAINYVQSKRPVGFEKLTQQEQKQIDYNKKSEFFDNLRKAFNATSKINYKEFETRIELSQFNSKEEYIESCARIGILNAVLLFYTGKSIYMDILENKRNVAPKEG